MARTTVAIVPAPAGIGKPTKYLLSTTCAWMLKRARRIEPQTTKRNDTIQPRRWKSASPHEYARTAGATPNETRSAIESYCSPNAEVEWVIRAIRPSSASRIPAAMIRYAETSNVPRIEDQIDR